MAMTNAEKQRRWRERHPEQAAAHLDALKAVKAPPAPCRHDPQRQVQVQMVAYYCADCAGVFYAPADLDDARALARR